MVRRIFIPLLVGIALFLTYSSSIAAGPADVNLLQSQRTAVSKLAFLDGTWRGQATIFNADGSTLKITQTERVGPMLDGTLRVIEGRGYRADGALQFNAFAVVSFAVDTKKYTMRSYAQGYVGDFPLEVRDDGFVWTLPAGPAKLRYTAMIKDDVWTEIGERLVEGSAPVKTFEMRVTRISKNADWPVAGAVLAK
jgi:hypothetical protein